MVLLRMSEDKSRFYKKSIETSKQEQVLVLTLCRTQENSEVYILVDSKVN